MHEYLDGHRSGNGIENGVAVFETTPYIYLLLTVHQIMNRSSTFRLRNEEKSFNESYIKDFHEKINEYPAKGWAENESSKDKYGAKEERALLRRIDKHRRDYFMWLEDFELPTTNNLSEIIMINKITYEDIRTV